MLSSEMVTASTSRREGSQSEKTPGNRHLSMLEGSAVSDLPLPLFVSFVSPLPTMTTTTTMEAETIPEAMEGVQEREEEETQASMIAETQQSTQPEQAESSTSQSANTRRDKKRSEVMREDKMTTFPITRVHKIVNADKVCAV